MAVGATQRYSQAHIRCATVGRVGQPAAGVGTKHAGHADQVSAQLAGAQTQIRQPLTQHLRGQPGAALGACAGIADLAFSQPAGLKADIGLERGGPGMALHTGQLHPVGCQLGDDGGADVGHPIGCQAGRRVMQLVQQLVGHGVDIHPATGAGWFGDHAVAVGVDLGDGVAQRGQAVSVFQAGVGAVATGDLGAAFQQVAGHGERGVGLAAVDHNLRASAQGCGNRVGAQVGIGADQRPELQRRPKLGLQQGAVGWAGHLVTLHHRNAKCGQA